MKKKGFLLFSLFVTLNILSQQKIALKGIILDQDNLPVPYASIGIISKNIGTTSTSHESLRIEINMVFDVLL